MSQRHVGIGQIEFYVVKKTAENHLVLGNSSTMNLLTVVLSVLVFASADVSAHNHSACKVTAVFHAQGLSASLKHSMTPQYLNCSVHPGQVASRIQWKKQEHVLKEGLGPIKWLGLSLDVTGWRPVEDVHCDVMVGSYNHSCRFEQEVPPRIMSRRHIYEAHVGTSLILPCRAAGNPQPVITWMKKDQSLATQDMPKSIKQVRSRGSLDLVIMKVSMMHRGVYTCQAVNRLGEDTYIFFVSPVYYSIPRPPRVVPLHRVVTVPRGSTAVLVCLAKNTPQPYTAAFWNHNGKTVMNSSRYHIKTRYSERIVQMKYKVSRLDMSLVIDHVTSKDVGLYTCGVVTFVGRHEEHVELRIKGVNE